MQQVQVTAFQSVQQESGLMSPPASGALDSPLARALAASAAGGLPVTHQTHLMWQQADNAQHSVESSYACIPLGNLL